MAWYEFFQFASNTTRSKTAVVSVKNDPLTLPDVGKISSGNVEQMEVKCTVTYLDDVAQFLRVRLRSWNRHIIPSRHSALSSDGGRDIDTNCIKLVGTIELKRPD
jgi:hypothetical protein